MIKFIYTEKDCSIYSNDNELNTGADEILDILSEYGENLKPLIARSLIEFDQNDLQKYYSDSNKFTLNLKIVQSLELSSKSEIEVYPVAESWEAGKGRFIDSEYLYPGCSWKYRNSNKDEWDNKLVEFDSGGGSWFESISDGTSTNKLSFYQSFENTASDIKIDITEIVKYWVTNQLVNNGLIIKFKDDTIKSCGGVKYFASDTNTIYCPYIEIGIDDFIFDPYKKNTLETLTSADTFQLDSGSLDSGSLDSGSLDSGSLDSGSLDSGSMAIELDESHCADSAQTDFSVVDQIIEEELTETIQKENSDLIELSTSNISVFISQIKNEYQKNEILRMEVGVREKYPAKKFSNRMRYSSKNFTKDALYYSVRDAETEEIMIDYSEYTKISCDSLGHYFHFDFSSLKRGRLYKFIIQQRANEIQVNFTDNRTFMIVS